VRKARPTLVYEIALSSKTAKKDLLYFRKIGNTRCAKLDRSQPASQPAAAKRTRAKAERDREKDQGPLWFWFARGKAN